MNNIPISSQLIEQIAERNGLPAPGSGSIREVTHLVNLIEGETGIKFVRMEMGVPGLPAPSIGIEAEIEALRSGKVSQIGRAHV